ncbi:MAG: hypothetical protein EXS13_06335 [Planctomycetes bacterium]|nr:hypothetical protein [Planctomycetota bacterium]
MSIASLLFACLPQSVEPIDFAAVPRAIAKEPAYLAAPRYGCFLFGENGERRMWAVLDKSDAKGAAFDVLHLDRDFDGDLTEAGERFAGKVDGLSSSEEQPLSATFSIGDLAVGEVKHTDFRIVWYATRISYRMQWRGDKVTMGPYAPTTAQNASFAPDLKTAPLFVPGHDRPFQFEHWMSGTLERGKETYFKVFVGNRGSTKGTFSCVDDKFLAQEEFAVATLIYTTTAGKEERVRNELRERC